MDETVRIAGVCGMITHDVTHAMVAEQTLLAAIEFIRSQNIHIHFRSELTTEVDKSFETGVTRYVTRFRAALVPLSEAARFSEAFQRED